MCLAITKMTEHSLSPGVTLIFRWFNPALSGSLLLRSKCLCTALLSTGFVVLTQPFPPSRATISQAKSFLWLHIDLGGSSEVFLPRVAEEWLP